MKNMKLIKKIKDFKLNKKSKKGFTLLESIIALAIFAIVAALFTTFILTSNKMLNNSYAIINQTNNLKNSLATGKSNKEQGVITNKDEILIDENNKIGKAPVYGVIQIDYDNARVVGPKKNLDPNDTTENMIGKKINKIKDPETNNDIAVPTNKDKNISIITVTQFDENNKPIRNEVIGIVKD